MVKFVVVGPGKEFTSGISNYTARLAQELDAGLVLYRRMMPARLFPGHARVGKISTKIWYRQTPEHLDWYNPVTWMEGVRYVRQHDFAIYQWWSSAVAHMLVFLAVLSRRRYAIELHEVLDPMESKNPALKAYSKLVKTVLFRNAEFLIAHNSKDAEHAKEYHNEVVVIPHPVYDHYSVAPLIRKDRFNILFFGLLREYKGLDVLLEAFRNFDVPDKHLVIAGENWDRIPVPRADNITHIDRYIHDDEVERIFNSCDVLVIPYLRGSASGVAAIGVHYGIPIIASRVDGIYEQLEDYEGVHWIDPGDHVGLTQWLYSIYSKERRRYPVPERLKWQTAKDLLKKKVDESSKFSRKKNSKCT